MTLFRRLKSSLGATVLVVLLSCLGCMHHSGKQIKRVYQNPYPRARSLAVTPFLNHSGSQDLEVIAVTDAFCTELGLIDGIEVAAVNRVLAALNELGLRNVSNPDEAVGLARLLQVDAVIVGAVTQYDPYYPPKVGMLVHLYAQDEARHKEEETIDAEKHVNPGEMARAGKVLDIELQRPMKPRAAVSRIIDADEIDVIERIETYASSRSGRDNPTSWRTYTTSSNYLRFVSHEIIGELLAQEQQWLENQDEGD